jgi:RNA polymerase sigma-70 factor (ECF subfamily)
MTPTLANQLTDRRLDEPELRDLMLASLAGGAAANEALLTRLSSLLRSYFGGRLIRIGRTPADAEDLVQETLISIYTHRHTYDRAQPLTPWAYAIARYRLVDYLRRTRTSAAALPLDEVPDLPAEGDSNAIDSGLDVYALIAQLSPKMRRAIELVKLQGLSVSEAAAHTDMSESAIKVSVHRGLKALSKLVRQRSPG